MQLGAPLLAVEGLNTYYGDSHILRDVDVTVASGEALGLLGRNGMGKTTLIRSIMGYVAAARGRIRMDGVDVTGSMPEKMARRGIGYVPEGRAIFPNLSVRENLVMCARAGGGKPKAVDLRASHANVPPAGRTPRPWRAAAFGRRAADAVDRARAADQPAPADPR